MKRLAVLAILAVAPIFAQADGLKAKPSIVPDYTAPLTQDGTQNGLDPRLAQNYFTEFLRAAPQVAEHCSKFAGLASASFNAIMGGKSKRDTALVAVPVGMKLGVIQEEALLAVDIAESATRSQRAKDGSLTKFEVQRMAFGFCVGAAAAAAGLQGGAN